MLSPTKTGNVKKPADVVGVPLPAFGTYTCTPGKTADDESVTNPESCMILRLVCEKAELLDKSTADTIKKVIKPLI